MDGKSAVRLSALGLMALCMAAVFSSAANASYNGLRIYYQGNLKIYEFEFKDYTVKQMKSWIGAIDNAASIVNRLLNDNFRNLGDIEKYFIMGIADAFVAGYLNSQANKYYTPGRSMYVTLEVNPKIASLCVSISKVRELWSSLYANFEIWYGFNVPWTALPCP
jgi:hypothetical protein